MRGGSAIRLAALSNLAEGRMFSPSGVWVDKTELQNLAQTGTLSELLAYAGNPSLSDRAIEDITGRKEWFSGLTERRWTILLLGLAKNPRLKEDYGPERGMDGWAEHSHHRVFRVCWELAESVPATQYWANTLYELLKECRTPYGLQDKAEAIVERWRIDMPRKPGERYHHPGTSLYLRSKLADLLEPTMALRHSPDQALRTSYFRRFDPAKDLEWAQALERDFQDQSQNEPDATMRAAVSNDRLWLHDENRQQLRSLCWAFPDPRHDMMLPQYYDDRLRLKENGNPHHFKTAYEEQIVSERRDGTSDGMSAIKAQLDDIAASIPRREPPAGSSEPAWATDILHRLNVLSASLSGTATHLAGIMDRSAQDTQARDGAKNPNNLSVRVPWWVWLMSGLAAGWLMPWLH